MRDLLRISKMYLDEPTEEFKKLYLEYVYGNNTKLEWLGMGYSPFFTGSEIFTNVSYQPLLATHRNLHHEHWQGETLPASTIFNMDAHEAFSPDKTSFKYVTGEVVAYVEFDFSRTVKEYLTRVRAALKEMGDVARLYPKNRPGLLWRTGKPPAKGKMAWAGGEEILGFQGAIVYYRLLKIWRPLLRNHTDFDYYDAWELLHPFHFWEDTSDGLHYDRAENLLPQAMHLAAILNYALP